MRSLEWNAHKRLHLLEQNARKRLRLLERHAHKTNASSNSDTGKKATALAVRVASFSLQYQIIWRSDCQANLCTIVFELFYRIAQCVDRFSSTLCICTYLPNWALRGIMVSCGTRVQLFQTQLLIAHCNGTHYWNCWFFVLYSTGVHARNHQWNIVSYHVTAYVCAVCSQALN